jgi:hypothetical protein
VYLFIYLFRVDSRLTKATSFSKVINTFIPQSALRQVHGKFQTEFPEKCDLVLPLSVTAKRIKSSKIQQCVEIFTGINES